ncbi:hypothetical protein DP43_2028 [Burkholderia pseudomallei]|nr:hypothetical protein DP43_2028 [Burkholderia pseudomallei]
MLKHIQPFSRQLQIIEFEDLTVVKILTDALAKRTKYPGKLSTNLDDVSSPVRLLEQFDISVRTMRLRHNNIDGTNNYCSQAIPRNY